MRHESEIDVDRALLPDAFGGRVRWGLIDPLAGQ
jgi:hypothetical protein